MHIKELVLDDFKSFGRKTRIPFYEDFTTISGPNGSGKSNIIDSVLFALGLARTSGIRAEKLTDLIFDPGHDDEGGFGGEREASVEVLLDNDDRTLTREQVVSAAGSEDVGDVDEISIRRRVKQTDEDTYYSYYYLNGRSVNLSDIRDLLAQAGVTPEGYNVVMQGDVTEIITMTPHSRREIIDEIAGVAEFDAKKEDAFEELETVQDRIEEADLRIEEKEERLDQLSDERETALQYKELREQKEEYEGYLKAAELEDKREEREEAQSSIDETEDELEALRRELDERQGKVTRLEEDLADLNREIEQKGEDEQLEIKREIEEIKGDIGRLEDKIEAQEERIEEAENARSQAFVQVDRKQETVDELEADIREKKVRKSSLKADREEKQAELDDVEAQIADLDTAYEDLREEIDAKRERLDELRDEKNELQREQDRLLDEARRRSSDQREKEEQIETAESQLPELEAEISDLESELEKAEGNLDSISEVVDDLKTEKAGLQEDLDELEDDIAAKQQEYAELEARAGESGDSSFGRAVSTVLNGGLDGVHGAVAQLGSVSPEYAEACETAAGGRMANVVVDDDSVGQRCIEYLKQRNAGRATFLPLTEMHSRSLPSVPSMPGVVDFAYNLVEFDSEYAEVFAYVLGDTLVVEDMETARDLMGEFRLVTLDGDLVEKSGAMTGGSTSGSRYSFEKGGEGQLQRVAEQIQSLEDERASLKEDIRDVEERLDDARDRNSDAADKVRDIEAAIERKQEEKARIEDEIASLEADLEDIEAEREETQAEMADVEEAIAEKEAEIDDLQTEIDDLQQELQDSEVKKLNDRAESIREDIAELDDQMEALDSDLNELQLEKQYAEDAIDELHEEIEAAQNKKADAEETVADLEDRIDEKESTLEAKHEEVAELEEELADLKEEREELRETVREAKERRDEKQKQVDAVESDLESLREQVERLDWEIDELESQVGEYDADDIPELSSVKGQITKLENRMEELEPVNMLAIDEYDRVEAELDDLTEKRATLQEEADGIRERIEAFEARKKETFMEAYEGINEHFEDIFARLSDGSGELVLEDPEEPFEGGLTMKAQPRDKPVQRLDAMSGGEKSLTALAFIFAIQRYNPAPFYALDEVDAFLDAANAEMVGEMVDDLAGDAQFIVVSHRSALLERSERAIGVTMQDDNISAVTGIDLSQHGVVADD
ncbi:chromosome segregation protein SMC [Halorarius halobius]|uniref:chromosome segregation protein SMC n=1 Tax=Halorarius halobius TaxID=2962671 RepID=UPI0020CBF158|nr:chromosome segregation protein SMC [Halorarius halobius]